MQSDENSATSVPLKDRTLVVPRKDCASDVPRKDCASDVPITVRPMAVEDLDQVVAIDQMSFSLPWPAHSFRYELFENDVARLWVADDNFAGTEATSAHKTSHVVGMIVVWLILDEAHIATIAVHPNYRRLGIGRQLILTALRECRAQGAASATLEVRENNPNAIDMYRKLGFEIVGRRKRYYKDTNEDAILMTLDMREPERSLAGPDRSLAEPEDRADKNGGEREA